MGEGSEDRHPVFAGVELGLGTFSWGDRLFWGYGRGYQDADIKAAFTASVASGVRFFDTAEVYGQGRSEQLLGESLKELDGTPVRVASKCMPFPWRLGRGSLLRALRGSLKRLGMSRLDLYQMHWPFPPISVEAWMEAMTDAYQAGLIGAVGVSNYDQDQMKRAQETLAREGIPLASNQVEYHLLNRRVEKNGLLKQCQSQGITLIAYSPLSMGLLTGKYNPDNPPGGMRANRFNRKYLQQIQPLVLRLKQLGVIHEGKTAAQVALNWVICKGALPIPGAKTLAQAEQNAGALGWRLSGEEIAELDALSDRVTGSAG